MKKYFVFLSALKDSTTGSTKRAANDTDSDREEGRSVKRKKTT